MPLSQRVPVRPDGTIQQTVYVDERFTVQEYWTIHSAAREWFFVSRKKVIFNFIYPSKIDESRHDRNVIIKTDSHHSWVTSREEKYWAIKERIEVLGFWRQWSWRSQEWYLYLVADRLGDLSKFRAVAMHELGHALFLNHHQNGEGILNSEVSMKVGCLTAPDMREFVRVYSQDLAITNYCEP